MTLEFVMFAGIFVDGYRERNQKLIKKRKENITELQIKKLRKLHLEAATLLQTILSHSPLSRSWRREACTFVCVHVFLVLELNITEQEKLHVDTPRLG